ncbi:MAG: hypothetical protein AAF555_11315 [Verrucomicrobiota bacterium]
MKDEVAISCCRGKDEGVREIDKLRERAGSDAALRARIEQEERFDQEVRAAWQRDCLAPPALAQQILDHVEDRTVRDGVITLSRRTLQTFALAACATLLAVGIWWLQARGDGGAGDSFVEFRQDMIQFASTDGIELDLKTNDLNRISGWLSQEQAPLPNALGPVASLETLGCKIIKWGEGKATLLCFRDQEGRVVHFFAIDREGMARGPEGQGPVLEAGEAEGPETLVWNCPDHFYLAFFDDEEVSVSELL